MPHAGPVPVVGFLPGPSWTGGCRRAGRLDDSGADPVDGGVLFRVCRRRGSPAEKDSQGREIYHGVTC